MANIWEYEPKSAYRARQAERFRREASTYAFNQMARQELTRRGHDPDQFNFSRTMFDQGYLRDPDSRQALSEYDRDDDSGGLFGKAMNITGDFLGTAGSVIKPVAKPALRGIGEAGSRTGLFYAGGKVLDALDWEQKHIGQNLYRGAVATLATPFAMAGVGPNF